jgi:hypothetical protein
MTWRHEQTIAQSSFLFSEDDDGIQNSSIYEEGHAPADQDQHGDGDEVESTDSSSTTSTIVEEEDNKNVDTQVTEHASEIQNKITSMVSNSSRRISFYVTDACIVWSYFALISVLTKARRVQ